MKVCDVIYEIPTFYSKAGIERVGPQPCRVIGIHPLERFYRVEFTAEVTGEKWRECFYFGARRGQADYSDPQPREQGEAYDRIGKKICRKEALYGY